MQRCYTRALALACFLDIMLILKNVHSKDNNIFNSSFKKKLIIIKINMFISAYVGIYLL